mmetsp:Transcript_52418/g.121885  ORF Transcript_52418/g.121885 Transcript_52418/m.121885 type:complete len:165 (+) Transcript_52418:44-538(+)
MRLSEAGVPPRLRELAGRGERPRPPRATGGALGLGLLGDGFRGAGDGFLAGGDSAWRLREEPRGTEGRLGLSERCLREHPAAGDSRLGAGLSERCLTGDGLEGRATTNAFCSRRPRTGVTERLTCSLRSTTINALSRSSNESAVVATLMEPPALRPARSSAMRC